MVLIGCGTSMDGSFILLGKCFLSTDYDSLAISLNNIKEEVYQKNYETPINYLQFA